MQEKYTEKLFFGKYDHRIIVKHSSWSKKDSKYRHPAVIDYLLEQAGVLNCDHRIRHTVCYTYKWNVERPEHRTYYFKDPALLEFFLEYLPDTIEEVMKPKNDGHVEALEKERVLVREKLFHGKYRYCIRTSAKWVAGTHRSTTKHMDEMVKWCEANFKDRTKDDMYIYKGWTKNFYFSNPADVMFFKLTWNEEIDRTERIKLVSELDD